MDEIVREMTREELIAENNKLRAELAEVMAAMEHNRHVADEEHLRGELRYREGVIWGLKYATWMRL